MAKWDCMPVLQRQERKRKKKPEKLLALQCPFPLLHFSTNGITSMFSEQTLFF